MKTIIIKETADNSFSDSDMVRMLDQLGEDFETNDFVPLTMSGDTHLFVLLPAALVDSSDIDEEELAQFLYRRAMGDPELTYEMGNIAFRIEPCEEKRLAGVKTDKRFSAILDICVSHGVDEETSQAIAEEVLSIL